MNCECGNDTRVVDTRSHKGVKYRKRKCICGKVVITKEITCEKFPYKKVIRKKKKVVYKVKKKRKPKPKPEPKFEFNGIPVTKKSPDWLKRIATLINQ